MPACLAGLREIDDVVLVDSGSNDSTLADAQTARTDVRIYTNPFEDFGQQRNWALDNTNPKHPWVLFIDADEYCTPEFLAELRTFLESPGQWVGAFIAGKNYFFGHWLRHCTMYPSYQLRLLKVGAVRYRKEGHGQREVTDGPLTYFKAGWIHNAMSKGLHQWIARHNQYSTDEAGLLVRLAAERPDWGALISREPIARRRALKQLAARLPLRPFVRFFYVYLLRAGFLDGGAGLRFCALRFAHDIHLVSKVAEERDKARRDRAMLHAARLEPQLSFAERRETNSHRQPMQQRSPGFDRLT